MNEVTSVVVVNKETVIFIIVFIWWGLVSGDVILRKLIKKKTKKLMVLGTLKNTTSRAPPVEATPTRVLLIWRERQSSVHSQKLQANSTLIYLIPSF